MEKHGMGMEKLKEEYEKLQKKHKLPSFKELNEDFHIEKIADTETEFLIREVRKNLGDKLANYMRFLENLLSPVNVPMSIFSIVKVLDSEDKKKLSDIYKELMKKELKFLELELVFNEQKEVQFINESYKFWQDVKKDLLKLIEKINEKWDDKSETSNKGYYG